MTLANGLKMARTLKGYSLRKVESLTGVSNAYLSQLESGKSSKPNPFYLHKLAECYGVDYALFMEQAGYLPKFDPAAPKASLFKDIELTGEEQDKLLWYLSFLRYKQTNPNIPDPIIGLGGLG